VLLLLLLVSPPTSPPVILLLLLPPPHTATQLLPVRALTCSVLVSTLELLNIVGVVDDDDDVDDDEDTDFDDDKDSFFDLLSPVLAVLVFLLLPTFMIRLLTAACATDLKSASVGGFDRIGAGVVELVATDFVFNLEATVIVFAVVEVTGIVIVVAVGTDDVALLLDDKTTSACGETSTCGIT
jgi:hypothetical protein